MFNRRRKQESRAAILGFCYFLDRIQLDPCPDVKRDRETTAECASGPIASPGIIGRVIGPGDEEAGSCLCHDVGE
jgi:hypothetical protein